MLQQALLHSEQFRQVLVQEVLQVQVLVEPLQVLVQAELQVPGQAEPLVQVGLLAVQQVVAQLLEVQQVAVLVNFRHQVDLKNHQMI